MDSVSLLVLLFLTPPQKPQARLAVGFFRQVNWFYVENRPGSTAFTVIVRIDDYSEWFLLSSLLWIDLSIRHLFLRRCQPVA